MESSLCEKPERHAPRRLSDHLGLEGLKQKVHSLVDKVYSRTNLTLAWERVRANRARMESVSRILRPIWRLIWIDCIESFETTPTNRNPCDGSRYRKEELRGRRGR